MILNEFYKLNILDHFYISNNAIKGLINPIK